MVKVLDIVVQATLKIDAEVLAEFGNDVYQTVKQLFTYKNPKYLDNIKWGYYNGDTPEFLYSFTVLDGYIYISRGGLDKLTNHLKKFKISVNVIDRTFVGPDIDFNQSNTIPRPDQKKWLDELLQHTNGCGKGYTSFGKTVASGEIIKRMRQRTTIIVHTTELQMQWINELKDSKLFNLEEDRFGGVGGIFGDRKKFYSVFSEDTKFKSRKLGDVNVCLYQSLSKENHTKFFEETTGLVIFDEGQKTPIDGVQLCVNNFRARYRYSVSADFERKDGKQFLTFDTFGPIRAVAVEKASASKIISEINLIGSPYEDEEYSDDGDYTAMISRMGRDRDRNILICSRAIKRKKEGKMVLILVERKEQAAILAEMLSKHRVDMIVGSVDKKKIQGDQRSPKEIKARKPKRFLHPAVIKRLLNYDDATAFDRVLRLANKKKLDFIIGTQKVEVGVSIRPLDGVITTTPQNNMERFNQIKGRPERTYSKEQEEYFGCKKPTPFVDVIVDYKMSVGERCSENIKEKYGNLVKIVKHKRKTIVRRRKK